MRYTYDHDLHIHSHLSLCSGHPEQTTENILAYARKNGLRTICLTDHYWDESVEGASPWYKKQDTAHVDAALPLPQAEGIRFLYGCETEMRADMTIGISRERMNALDFIIIPTTHMHMKEFTVPQALAGRPEGLARLWLEKIEALMAMDLPFHKIGLAHLACPLIGGWDDALYQQTLAALTDEALKKAFSLIAKRGAGVEINQSDFSFRHGGKEDVLRIFRIAKACGCKFYLGTDAHEPEDFESSREIFENAIELLELRENDKFPI